MTLYYVFAIVFQGATYTLSPDQLPSWAIYKTLADCQKAAPRYPIPNLTCMQVGFVDQP